MRCPKRGVIVERLTGAGGAAGGAQGIDDLGYVSPLRNSPAHPGLSRDSPIRLGFTPQPAARISGPRASAP